jgi:hypothetical protein
MSMDIPRNVCPEAKNGHEFTVSQGVTILKRNLEAGCEVCGLLFRALEKYHGPWFREHADSLRFRRFASFAHSLRIDTFLDEAAYFTDGVKKAEFVYEEAKLR